MARRILLVDDTRAVITAIRRDLEERGVGVDAVAPAEAVAKAGEGNHCAALVRGAQAGGGLVESLRRADPHLPIVLLLVDAAEARAVDRAEADAVLEAPFTASGVASVCALAARLRERSVRISELETRAAARPGGSRDLEFLKRLLLAEVKRSKRYGYPLSLALVAVDGWEEKAAKLAPRTRTQALGTILGAISGTLRDIDVAVPFSGERFVVVMPHTKADGGLRVARRLAAVVRDRESSPRLTASVGVATHGGDGTVSFGGLVKRAGEALARARAAGGDRAEPADPVKKRDRISIA